MQYLLEKEETNAKSVEVEEAVPTPTEEVAEKAEESPPAVESNPVSAVEEKAGDLEECSEAPPAAEEKNDGEEAAEEEAPGIKLETAPADFRFPTTNQTRHCFTRYIEYHRCVEAKGEDAQECDKFAKYYRSLCPSEWIERWNEQRENGTFPGPL
ncbi:PREDICTED: cytochrome c oxidase subunit 6b-1-like isoform X2 [Tarenaya hassleriana]|uniref:cytochrome c oxidase subunit 6b-1-like isoform X2 n=1 Tax=Tarenaya hassleriana TaxID=28532 RepID=UPI00053C8588|nr:PREDICTED: cytochrome c oxidase subunit 6b-1-like isoform X2 [Tarenaya hassleriana]